MKITIVQRAEPNERFAADALDGNIGKSLIVNLPGGSVTDGTVVGAKVAPDGGSAEVTIEISEAAATSLPDLGRLAGLSVAYHQTLDLGPREQWHP